jgi:hypothetical protein
MRECHHYVTHVYGCGAVDGFAGGQEIALPETIEVGAVDGKEREAAVERVEFVEIEREEKNPMEQAVGPGREARVQDVAFVKAGIHRGWRRAR